MVLSLSITASSLYLFNKLYESSVGDRFNTLQFLQSQTNGKRRS